MLKIVQKLANRQKNYDFDAPTRRNDKKSSDFIPFGDKNRCQKLLFPTNKNDDGHQVFTVEQTKKSISALDTKRFIMADGIATQAFGHYSQRAQ